MADKRGTVGKHNPIKLHFLMDLGDHLPIFCSHTYSHYSTLSFQFSQGPVGIQDVFEFLIPLLRASGLCYVFIRFMYRHGQRYPAAEQFVTFFQASDNSLVTILLDGIIFSSLPFSRFETRLL